MGLSWTVVYHSERAFNLGRAKRSLISLQQLSTLSFSLFYFCRRSIVKLQLILSNLFSLFLWEIAIGCVRMIDTVCLIEGRRLSSVINRYLSFQLIFSTINRWIIWLGLSYLGTKQRWLNSTPSLSWSLSTRLCSFVFASIWLYDQGDMPKMIDQFELLYHWS